MSARNNLPIVNLADKEWPLVLRGAVSSAEPLVLTLSGPTGDQALTDEFLPALLSRPMPVTGVIAGDASGRLSLLFLACDEVFWCKKGRLSLEPTGRGEVALLSMRIGQAAAGRVWFSGGVLKRSEAVRSGWAVPAGNYESALKKAISRYSGLSANALSLLRELLYRESGLPLLQAQALERAAFAMAFASSDPAEGIAAFLEKRRALFTPRRQ